MRVCGRWFDASLRERIMGEVTHLRGISRNALAAKVCGWMGWHNPRGQRQLASTRKALGRLDRCGAIRLPAVTPASEPGCGSTPRAPCTPPPVTLAQAHSELSALGPVEVVAVDSPELRCLR
jgi:hypothetical protein